MPEGLRSEDIDALGEAARQVLLKVYGGAELTRPQTAGGCLFWFLDGSVIGDDGPRELQVRELIQTLRPGAISLTERGRALAERLRTE
jgi:hypothetical protein